VKSGCIAHLVNSEDLNHHGTLFAGRMAEWFVEACFIAVASVTRRPESIVCVSLQSLEFKRPANKGDIVTIETCVVQVGRTSITVQGQVLRNGESEHLVEGQAKFVHVDAHGRAIPHGLAVQAVE